MCARKRVSFGSKQLEFQTYIRHIDWKYGVGKSELADGMANNGSYHAIRAPAVSVSVGDVTV